MQEFMSAAFGHVVRAIVVSAAATLGLTAVGQAAAAEKVSMRLKWIAQAQFVGFYVAKAKGFYEAEGLDMTINPGGPNLNGETLVASNSDNFAVAGGLENLLGGRAKGLPIVGIGMMLQRTPSAYVTRVNSGIRSPKDFKGKTVSTFFTGANNTLYAMLAKEGVPLDSVKIIPQAVSMAPFIDGQVDVATVMLFNELIVLQSKGIDVRVFRAEDYGVNFPNDFIITNETMIKERPRAVQGFMNASLRGWKYAAEHQEEALDILMQAAPGLERKHQAAMLAEYVKLMMADQGTQKGIAVLDVERLEVVRQFQIDRKALTVPITLSEALNTTFWDAVPVAYKKP
jgi:NitT/TauT family transport system substrate-binding protein